MGSPKSAKAAKAAVSEFAPLADELGALEKEMAPFKQKLARIEALKESARAGCPVAPTLPWTVEGERFIASLGACANQRVIDIPRLVKAIGAGVYAKFATCSLEALKKCVAPAIVAAVVSSKEIGSRSLKTFEKGIV